MTDPSSVMARQSARAFSYRQAVERTSLSLRTLQRMAKRGELGVVRLGARVVIPESELLRLIEQGTKHP
jgi:excisionase family DNA binding protein